MARTENPDLSACADSGRSYQYGDIAVKLLQVMVGNEAASTEFDVGQVAAAHLVVQRVAGEAGQAGGFVDGVGQPPGMRAEARRRSRRPPGRSLRMGARSRLPAWSGLLGVFSGDETAPARGGDD